MSDSKRVRRSPPCSHLRARRRACSASRLMISEPGVCCKVAGKEIVTSSQECFESSFPKPAAAGASIKPCHYRNFCAKCAHSLSRSDGMNLAVRLWSLRNKCNNKCGAICLIAPLRPHGGAITAFSEWVCSASTRSVWSAASPRRFALCEN